MGYLNDNFFFINTMEADITIDGILAKTAELVLRKGIKGLLIDPWNYIEHKVPNGQTETQYISDVLSKIRMAARKLGIHIFLIAHPTKLQKDKATGKYEVPTMYSISGSANFFNKTDNGLTIYRDFETNVVTAYVQKIRWWWLGKVGFTSFSFNTLSRQYEAID
jgi:twinkle protein